MYPDWDTIRQLLPAPEVLLRLLQEKSKYITKHLMSGHLGNYITLFQSNWYSFKVIGTIFCYLLLDVIAH